MKYFVFGARIVQFFHGTATARAVMFVCRALPDLWYVLRESHELCAFVSSHDTTVIHANVDVIVYS